MERQAGPRCAAGVGRRFVCLASEPHSAPRPRAAAWPGLAPPRHAVAIFLRVMVKLWHLARASSIGTLPWFEIIASEEASHLHNRGPFSALNALAPLEAILGSRGAGGGGPGVGGPSHELLRRAAQASRAPCHVRKIRLQQQGICTPVPTVQIIRFESENGYVAVEYWSVSYFPPALFPVMRAMSTGFSFSVNEAQTPL